MTSTDHTPTSTQTSIAETEASATDNIHIQVFPDDVDSLAAARSTAPTREHRTHNIVRGAYHEELVAGLNGAPPDITVDKLALGSSTAGTSTLAKTAPLGNETLRVSITDTFTDGQTFTASIFLDSTQGNGQTFEEAALVAEQSGGDLPVNRFLIDDPGGLLAPKADDETVTIDIEITHEDG
jgi:hypothetical protein